MPNLLNRLQRDFRKAPNLRVSTGNGSCDTCAHFDYLSGRSWSGDGLCYLYDVPVREDFVCDSFVSVEEVDELPDGDGKRKRAAVVRHKRPRQVPANNAFYTLDVALVDKPRANPSTADLLAELNANKGVA